MNFEDDVVGMRLYEHLKESHPDIAEMLVITEEKDEDGDPYIGFKICHPENQRAIEFCSIEEHIYFEFSEYNTHVPLYPKPIDAFERVVAHIRDIMSGDKVSLIWLTNDEEVPPLADLIPNGDEAFFEFLYEDADKVYVEGWSHEDDRSIK